MKITIKQPVVSIVIPTYNSASFVEYSIASAINQSYKNIEVIVVDDGSTDDTRKKLEKFKEKIRYFYQANKGVSNARNKGVSVASGSYVIFLDADDLLFPDIIQLCITALSSQPDYKAIYGLAYSFSNNDSSVLKEWTHTPRKSGCIFDYVIKGLSLAQGQFMIERDCIRDIGGFDEKLNRGEDWQFLLKATRKYNFLYAPYPFLKRRIHAEMETIRCLPHKADIVSRRLSILRRTFAAEAEQLRRKYITNRVIADWYEADASIYFKRGEVKKAYKSIMQGIVNCPYHLSLYQWILNKVCFSK